jgi:choice-of-anchor A domain-containing protein
MGDKKCSDIVDANGNPYTLVAGMSVDMMDTEIKVGHVAYGYTENHPQSTIASDCSFQQTSQVVDFGKAFAYLTCLSRTLKKMDQTGRYTAEYNQLVLYGSGERDTEVFNIAGLYLSSATSFEIRNVKAGATIVINVSGGELALGNFEFFPVGQFPQQYVVWNFFEATKIRFYSVGWRGTVLAPNALIGDSNGVIHGQVFAKSWEQRTICIQVNWVPFKGCLPDCDSTPLPPTVGCADGKRDGFFDQRRYPCIAACSTKWSSPGVVGQTPKCQRQAGDDFPNQPDGCSVEDACAPGWHVCASQEEVETGFRHDGSCLDAGAGFYTSQVSGPGCGRCAFASGTNSECDGANCRQDCSPNTLTRNDLFGCGTLTNANGEIEQAYPDPLTCGPFNIFSGNLCGSVPGLNCGAEGGYTEADVATKSEYPGGGVLCCADQCLDRTDNPEYDNYDENIIY